MQRMMDRFEDFLGRISRPCDFSGSCLKMLKKLSVKEIKTSTKIYSSQASVLGLL